MVRAALCRYTWMNNLCKKLAQNIKIKLNCDIAPLGEKKQARLGIDR